MQLGINYICNTRQLTTTRRNNRVQQVHLSDLIQFESSIQSKPRSQQDDKQTDILLSRAVFNKDFGFQPILETKPKTVAGVKELEKQELNLLIQSELEVKLPDWQSVEEFSIAPTQIAQEERAKSVVAEKTTSISALAEVLQEQGVLQGSGQLKDGSRWQMQSGEEKGEHGYWYRWQCVVGSSADEKARWMEKWWEASDWLGLKELGAEKTGTDKNGKTWKETWNEKIAYEQDSSQRVVERYAHKWCSVSEECQEWEEKWKEHYKENGSAWKWADKWAKEGSSKVWHERWGEDYDGQGGCLKWTDKWAEELQEEGGQRTWGDKWEERFKDGIGTKKGETWEQAADGNRYQRWWGEDHLGSKRVRKWGNSTSGEHWDVEEEMDTYYNPIPHYGYQHAVSHSPQLKQVAMLPRTGDVSSISLKNF